MSLTGLFLDILSMSLASSAVILLVLGVRYLLRRAPKRFSYILWAVVLFRLLCPVTVEAPFSLFRVIQTVQTQVQEEIQPFQETGGTAQKEGTFSVYQQDAFRPEYWLSGIWAMGVGGVLLWGGFSSLRLRKHLVGTVRLWENIYLADHIHAPFVKGVFQPRIYLPSTVQEREMAYILAHEQHHIRRRDHIIKWLAYLALCIHWFNPLVWAAFQLAGKDMEMSCDEAVIRDLGDGIRASYARSLMRFATGHSFADGISVSFGKGDTEERMKNMVNWKKTRKWILLVAALTCAAVMAACAVDPIQTGRVDPIQVGNARTNEANSEKADCTGENCTDTSHRHEYADSPVSGGTGGENTYFQESPAEETTYPQESTGENPDSQESAGENPYPQGFVGENPDSQESVGENPYPQEFVGESPDSQESAGETSILQETPALETSPEEDNNS